MKQTAVEWLYDWMDKNQYFIGNDLLQAVQQAKEMEKEQMMDAYTHDRLMLKITGEQYYKETFKSE